MSGVQLEFVGEYRGHEIFAKPVSGGTQYIAFRSGATEPVARCSALANVMGVIDALEEDERRHREAGA